VAGAVSQTASYAPPVPPTAVFRPCAIPTATNSDAQQPQSAGAAVPYKHGMPMPLYPLFDMERKEGITAEKEREGEKEERKERDMACSVAHVCCTNSIQ